MVKEWTEGSRGGKGEGKKIEKSLRNPRVEIFLSFIKLWKYDSTFTRDLENCKTKLHIVPL